MVETLLFELVIPCFNEAHSLEALVKKSADGALQYGLTPQTFQLILVDNGSLDQTSNVLSNLKQTDLGQWFRVLMLKNNQGYGGGIYEGLKNTQAPWVGFTHADLQCDPQDAIRAFLNCKESQRLTLVKGKRKNRAVVDWIVSRIFEFSVGLLWGFWCFDINAQPKVFSRELLEKIKQPPRGISFDAFVLWTAKRDGYFISALEVSLLPRSFGQSHWNQGFQKRLLTFLNVLKELLKTRITVQSP
ncbi:MAG: glycosyltransferase family 2 protein [Pseudomonadota bacterium]